MYKIYVSNTCMYIYVYYKEQERYKKEEKKGKEEKEYLNSSSASSSVSKLLERQYWMAVCCNGSFNKVHTKNLQSDVFF